MADHWRTTAEMDVSDPKLLGEDDRGDLWVPTRRGWWGVRFNPHNPRHWRYWLRSRLKGRLAMIEIEPSEDT